MLQRALPYLMFLILAACAPALQAPRSSQPKYPGDVSIEVVNDHLTTVTVFLMRGSDRFRLGEVEVNATKRFYVSAARMDVPSVRVRLEPHDLESPYVSEPFWAEPGQRIAFRVGQQVASSLRIQ